MATIPPAAISRQSRLRGFLRQRPAQVPLVTTQEDLFLEQPEFTPILPLAHQPPPSSPEAYQADIAAHVLGPLELSVAGERVSRWSSLKARAVFQYLLIHQDRPIRR